MAKMNPIDVADSQKYPNGPPPTADEVKFTEGCLFWIFAWFGTAIAGSIFGVFVGLYANEGISYFGGMFLGCIFGFFFAGMFAVLVHLHLAFFTWAFWLSRYRVAVAALAGGVTGILATKIVFGFHEYVGTMMVTAGFMGAMGSGLLSYRFCRSAASRKIRPVWQFSLRDLFVHFTAVALLISFWTTLYTRTRAAQERREQERQQQLKNH